MGPSTGLLVELDVGDSVGEDGTMDISAGISEVGELVWAAAS